MATLTGKDGQFAHNGVAVIISEWTAKVAVKMADVTASNNYDTNSALVWNSQLPVSANVEVGISGPWDPTNHSGLLTSIIAGSVASVNGQCRYATNSNAITGTFNISDLEIKTPTEDKVTYSATLKSNGRITLA
jgi:predicted secreted protein